MAGAICLSMPWPPSVNRLWRHVVVGGHVRVLLSRDGRAWRRAALASIRADLDHLGQEPLAGRVMLDIDACPPDRRRRDIDNLLKPALDALTDAGAWLDDSQVAALSIVRRPPVPGGRLDVRIRELDG